MRIRIIDSKNNLNWYHNKIGSVYKARKVGYKYVIEKEGATLFVNTEDAEVFMLDDNAPIAPHNTQIAGDHYKNMCIQPSEFIQKNNLSWCEGNVIKYVCRHKHKNGVEDIDKAIHYLQLIKEWEYGG